MTAYNLFIMKSDINDGILNEIFTSTIVFSFEFMSLEKLALEDGFQIEFQ